MLRALFLFVVLFHWSFFVSGPSLPNPLIGPGYVQFGDTFLVIGGFNSDGGVYDYVVRRKEETVCFFIRSDMEIETVNEKL